MLAQVFRSLELAIVDVVELKLDLQMFSNNLHLGSPEIVERCIKCECHK